MNTLPLLLLFFSTICFANVLGLDHLGVHESTLAHIASPERKLRAAKRSDKLSRRDVKSCLSYGHTLHYLDGERSKSVHPT